MHVQYTNDVCARHHEKLKQDVITYYVGHDTIPYTTITICMVWCDTICTIPYNITHLQDLASIAKYAKV